MSIPCRIIVDECLGRPQTEELFRALPVLLGTRDAERCDIKHILEFQRQGVYDEVWVPQHAADGWILLSSDRGSRGKAKKGERLPLVCRRHRMTLVMLSGTINNKPVREKFAAILLMWKEIARLAGEPPGGQYLLKMTGSAPNFVLVQKMPPPPTDTPNVPVQGELFADKPVDAAHTTDQSDPRPPQAPEVPTDPEGT